MMISNAFAPLAGLSGGALIGSSAASLLLLNGDILGASGIVSSSLLPPFKTSSDPKQKWKLAFLSAFSLTSSLLLSQYYDISRVQQLSSTGYVIGGLFVGFGTMMGNGCTSGHGICGLARFSLRSLASVCTFMLSAVITSTATAHIGALRSAESAVQVEKNSLYGGLISLGAVVATLLAVFRSKGGNDSNETSKVPNSRKYFPAVLSGLLFSLGLHFSQMGYSSKVNGFLDMNTLVDGSGWDPTLMMVMGGGLAVSFISYQLLKQWQMIRGVPTLQRPLFGDVKFNVPLNFRQIDFQLLLGAVTFGIGWGVAGICPGPALSMAATGIEPVLLNWWPGYFVGAYLARDMKARFFQPKPKQL